MKYFFDKEERRKWKKNGKYFNIGKRYSSSFEVIYDDMSVEIKDGYVIDKYSEVVDT